MALVVDKHRLVRAAQDDIANLVSTIEDMPDEEAERVLSGMLASDELPDDV